VKLQRFGGKPSTRSGEDPRYTSHVGQNLFLDAARCKWYAYPEKWFLAFKGRTYYHREHTLRDIFLWLSVGRSNIHRVYKLQRIGPLASQPSHQFVPLTVALNKRDLTNILQEYSVDPSLSARNASPRTRKSVSLCPKIVHPPATSCR
jgi:hypothetical protein